MADKNPNKIIDDLNKTEKYGDKFKTPLEEFEDYENSLNIGLELPGEREYYGIPYSGFGSKFQTPYPKLIEAYSKSKGKFADKALTDPEIKKYHDSRMAERAALYDRVRKIPQDKRADFLNGYGYFQDPFDYEGENIYGSDDESINKFLDWIDYNYADWSTLEDYLKEGKY